MISKKFVKYRIARRNRFLWRNKWDQRNLKNKSFSLFSHNCLGGIMYHDLGVEFQSPTINMRFTPSDFITLMQNLEFYLNADIEWLDTDSSFPVGLLGGGIRIDFVHYKDKAEVIDKWNERKRRVHKDNIFLICCDEGLSFEQIKVFDELPYENKILFTSKRMPEIKSAIFCPDFPDKTDVELLQFADWFGKRYYQKYFDYVRWFNGEKDFII